MCRLPLPTWHIKRHPFWHSMACDPPTQPAVLPRWTRRPWHASLPCSILPAVFDTLELTDLIATIEANIIFSNITGLVKVELYLRSEFGSWILIETFLSPTLIINYIIDVGDLELFGGLYYFKVVF